MSPIDRFWCTNTPMTSVLSPKVSPINRFWRTNTPMTSVLSPKVSPIDRFWRTNTPVTSVLSPKVSPINRFWRTNTPMTSVLSPKVSPINRFWSTNTPMTSVLSPKVSSIDRFWRTNTPMTSVLSPKVSSTDTYSRVHYTGPYPDPSVLSREVPLQTSPYRSPQGVLNREDTVSLITSHTYCMRSHSEYTYTHPPPHTPVLWPLQGYHNHLPLQLSRYQSSTVTITTTDLHKSNQLPLQLHF